MPELSNKSWAYIDMKVDYWVIQVIDFVKIDALI